MAFLPDEILFEVLLLSPAKSIGRFRCVCKSWHNLLTSSDFLNIYNNTHKKILISSFFAPIWFQSMNCNSPVVIEKVKIPNFCNWSQRILHLFSSCNGLVLNVLDGDLFLWNPTRDSDCMKLPRIQQDLSRFYGLGYVSSMDDFRVVSGGKSGVKMYSRKSNSWKTIQQFPVDVGDIWKMVGTGFNGFLHWIVFTEDMERRKGIVSLDLETEEYKVLLQPDDMTSYNRYVLIYLGVLEGFLCVVYDYYGEGPKVWTIWVMEEYGVKDSWFKILEIPRLNISNMVIPLSVTNGEIIMQVDYEKIVKYDPISEEFKTLVDCQFCIESLVYSESLTAPIEAKRFMQRNKRKALDLCKGTKEI